VLLLKDVATQIKGKCLCALGEFSIEAVLSGIERFEADFRQVAVDQPVEEPVLVAAGAGGENG